MFIYKNYYISALFLVILALCTNAYSFTLYKDNPNLIHSGIYPTKEPQMVVGYLYSPTSYIPIKRHKRTNKIKKLSLAIHNLNPNIPLNERYKIAKYIIKYTKHISWPNPITVASVIYVESTFNKNARSYGGCIGLMQLSSQWENQFPSKAFNSIKYNIKYGVKLLRYNYKEYHRDPFAALLIYNSGPVAYQRGYAPVSYYYKINSAEKRIAYLLDRT